MSTTQKTWTIDTDNPGPEDGLVGLDDRIAREILSSISLARATGSRGSKAIIDDAKATRRVFKTTRIWTENNGPTTRWTVEEIDGDTRVPVKKPIDAPAAVIPAGGSVRIFGRWTPVASVQPVEDGLWAARTVHGNIETIVTPDDFSVAPESLPQHPLPKATKPVPADGTKDRAVRATALRDLDRDFLSRIPAGGWSLTSKPAVDWMNDDRTEAQKAAEWTAAHLDGFSVVIAWEGEFGIDIGVVRSRFPAGKAGRTEDTFEASPFPGAWTEVPLSKIVSVRASTTL